MEKFLYAGIIYAKHVYNSATEIKQHFMVATPMRSVEAKSATSLATVTKKIIKAIAFSADELNRVHWIILFYELERDGITRSIIKNKVLG